MDDSEAHSINYTSIAQTINYKRAHGRTIAKHTCTLIPDHAKRLRNNNTKGKSTGYVWHYASHAGPAFACTSIVQ